MTFLHHGCNFQSGVSVETAILLIRLPLKNVAVLPYSYANVFSMPGCTVSLIREFIWIHYSSLSFRPIKLNHYSPRIV